MGAGQLTVVRFTIANGETVSNEHDVRAQQILAFQMPAAWTAGDMSFQSRPWLGKSQVTGTWNDDWQDVYDDEGDPVSLTVVQGHYVVLTGTQLDAMAAVAGLKIVSENAQGQVTNIIAVCAPIGA